MKSTDYESSAAWSATSDLAALLNDDLQAETDEEREAAVRLHETVAFLEAYRDATKPEMVDPGPLNDLTNYVTQVKNAVTIYNQDRDANRAHLVSAGQQCVNIMNTLKAGFPPLMGEPLAAATKASATRYANSLGQHIESLNSEIAKLREALASEQTKRSESEAAVTTRQSELEAAITTAGDTITQLTERLDAQITDQAAQFAKERASRGTAFEEWRDERMAELNERADEIDAVATTAREAQGEKADALLESLQGFDEQARKLIDSTSRHAVSGNYAAWADHQARAAFRWTVLATVIGVIVVGGLTWAMHSASDDSAQFVAYKISVGVLAAAVAAYAAKQAAEHRVQERRFKRLALDLAALEPFLATLDDATEIREEFAKRVFAPEQSEDDGAPSGTTGAVQISGTQVFDLLKGIVKGG